MPINGIKMPKSTFFMKYNWVFGLYNPHTVPHLQCIFADCEPYSVVKLLKHLILKTWKFCRILKLSFSCHMLILPECRVMHAMSLLQCIFVDCESDSFVKLHNQVGLACDMKMTISKGVWGVWQQNPACNPQIYIVKVAQHVDCVAQKLKYFQIWYYHFLRWSNFFSSIWTFRFWPLVHKSYFKFFWDTL